jgi:endonuclease-3
LGLDGLIGYVKTIGLYPTKAKNIMAMSQILMEKFGGQIPDTREGLESLPGVGRKTANVVLNVAFHACTFPVDTHVFRVANRLQIAPGKTPLEVEKGLEKSIPKEFCNHAHHWLILHGRYVCKARAPMCPTCVLNDLCPYEPKTKG